jgi:hypothetical protein
LPKSQVLNTGGSFHSKAALAHRPENVTRLGGSEGLGFLVNFDHNVQ